MGEEGLVEEVYPIPQKCNIVHYELNINMYHIALYFRGPKLSRLQHAKQFHEIIFTISGMALTSYRVLQLQHLSYIRVGNYGGISLDKSLAKRSL